MKTEKGRQLADWRGGRGEGGAKSHISEKAWPSINHSILPVLPHPDWGMGGCNKELKKMNELWQNFWLVGQPVSYKRIFFRTFTQNTVQNDLELTFLLFSFTARVRNTVRNWLGKTEEGPGLALVDADGGVGVQRWRCRLISHSLHHHPGKKLTSNK